MFRLKPLTTHLPRRVDAVVVGGGAIGASVSLHLQRLGVNVLLLESHKLTSGTTFHSAGMLWRLRPHHVDVELHTYTRELCKSYDDVWSENGGLYVGSTLERMEEYTRLSDMGHYYGIPSRVLPPDEVKAAHPLLDTSDIKGALFSPTDGTIDPTLLTQALAAEATRLGATILEDVPVVDVKTERVHGKAERVTGVVTPFGTVETTHVVNACGAWAPRLAAMVGATIPVVTMKHAYVVTESIPGMRPSFPNVRDHDLSVYLKTQGNALSVGGYEGYPEAWDVDDEARFSLFNLDWDVFEQNMKGCIQRCPELATTGIQTTVCGPETFTPDHKALVGPQGGVDGFWHCCAFNSMGLMLSGGIGRQLATWIVNGTPELDLFAYHPSRFNARNAEDAQWVLERSHESYRKTYSIAFKYDEAMGGRRAPSTIRSPLHTVLKRMGCVYQSRHGIERPGWFVERTVDAPEYSMSRDHPVAVRHYQTLIAGECTYSWPSSFDYVAHEARACRAGAAVFDQSYMGKFVLTGEGCDEAVRFLCAADVVRKEVGSVVYTPLCNEDGGVEMDITVTRLPDGYYFCTPGSMQSKDRDWLQRRLLKHGFGNCTLEDRSSTHAILSVQGPSSKQVLDGFMETNLEFSKSGRRLVDGMPVTLMRMTFVGEHGYEIHLPNEHCQAVYDRICRVGSELSVAGGFPFVNAGYMAMDSLSAEKNYRHWHVDLSAADSVFECGLGFTVRSRLKRGDDDFLGRAALLRQMEKGVSRRLVCLTVDDPNVLSHANELIRRNGECVGLVRMASYGHTLQRSVVTGYVDSGDTLRQMAQDTWTVGGAMATFHTKAPLN